MDCVVDPEHIKREKDEGEQRGIEVD